MELRPPLSPRDDAPAPSGTSATDTFLADLKNPFVVSSVASAAHWMKTDTIYVVFSDLDLDCIGCLAGYDGLDNLGVLSLAPLQ